MNERLEAAAARVRAQLDVEPTALADIEARGRVLRRRRRVVQGGVGAALVLVVVGASVAVADRAGDDDPGERITAGPATTEPGGIVTIGTVELPTGPIPDTPQAINAEILAAVALGDLAGYTPDHPGPVVTIDLLAGREGIADALVARYGDRIAVRVGNLPWPPATEPPAYDCPTLVGSAPEGITVELELDRSTVPVGELIRGTVVVRNETATTAGVSYGAWVVAHVVRRGTTTPVAANFGGGMPAVLQGADAPPGGVTEPMPAMAGIGSCTPGAGTALQPGDYEVIAVVGVSGYPDAILSAPVPLTIVPPGG